jgi:hypothetical protein
MTARETGAVELPEIEARRVRKAISDKLINYAGAFYIDCGDASAGMLERAAKTLAEEVTKAVFAALSPQPAPSATGEIVERATELLAQLEEIDGNKAGAFALRSGGIVGTHFHKKLEAVTAFSEQQAATIAELREACDVADKRLCELTPNFPPDVGPDMRDAEEIEKTGVVVMQIRATLERTRGQ